MLPAPEPDEVVSVALEELQVGVEVVLLGCTGEAGSETIVEVVPDVRPGQVDNATVAPVARRDREVAGVVF
jgi:hypothetical protein